MHEKLLEYDVGEWIKDQIKNYPTRVVYEMEKERHTYQHDGGTDEML